MTCVLLAEDDFELRMSFLDLLDVWGFEVLEAEDGAEALTYIEKIDHLSLLMTDINMPKFTGLEVAENARIKFPAVPILFVTGHERLVEECFIEKPFICLSKPCRSGSLFKAIRELSVLAERNLA